METPKKIVIIAGPNGAGKTTFAHEYLPREVGCPDFINMDLIAAGLSPFAPERAAVQAGRVMLQELRRRARAGESFAFETTLAGRQYARGIPQWRAAGYHVKLIFLRLPNVELALAWVAARVAQGGMPCQQRWSTAASTWAGITSRPCTASWLIVGSFTTPRGPSRSP